MSLGLRSNIHSYGIFNSLLNFAADIPDFTAAYSLRYLTIDALGDPVVKVRRDSDQSEKDFTPFDLQSSNLSNFIYSVGQLPADFGGGADTAYSLRYVTSTGKEGDPVVQVRKDIITNPTRDFTPDELTNGTLDKFADGNDCYVSIWYDQKGTNNAIQTSASSQPKIYDAVNGLVTENGKPALDFDGVDDFLNASTVNISQPTSYFITYRYKYISDINYTDIIDGEVSRQLTDVTTGGLLRIFAGANFVSTLSSVTTQVLRFSLFNSSSSAIAVNGGAADTGDAGTNSINDMNIGKSSTNHLNATLQEIIIYASDQSANRGAIENTINNYYNIYSSQTEAFVSAWYDQSGNGNHALQSADASQPKIWDSSTGLVTEGGRPALDFASDFLEVPSSTGSFNYLHDGTTSAVFGVVTFGKVANPDAAYGLIGNSRGSVDVGIFVRYDDRTGISNDAYSSYITNGTSGAASASTGAEGVITPNQNNIVTTFFDADNVTASERLKAGVNGGVLIENNPLTNAPSTSNATYNLQIGARGDDSFPLTGYVQEIIIYNSDQSANRTDIENNINAYYVVYGVLHYRQRVADDSGTFAIEDRDQTVYNSVTIPEMPSLICSCDAYKATKLYNINPA